ncbi:MAG: CPBP family intramembrane glutamic endopeptidase [Bryobacteraceae bacterium]
MPLALGFAAMERLPDQQFNPASTAFLTLALLFGAIGEEMLFRGYGFQIAIGAIGRIAAVVITSLVFGWAHSNNQNVSWLGLVNTIGFGVVLAYAFLRSGDLWLPIGLHFGWNWIFPLFGISLSGFTMEVTGYAMRWNVPELWSGGAYGPEASIPVCGVIVALLFFLYRAPVSSQIPPLAQPRQEA